MKKFDALENEKARQDKESWNKIFLHKDGKFYHAYDWSAWLIKNFVCTEEFQKQRGDEKVLSVSRYKTKNSDYTSLGFPVESVSKYIPNYDAIDTLEDDLVLTINFPFQEQYTYEELIATVDKWREDMLPVETKKIAQRYC